MKEEQQYEELTCSQCNGSGEGMHDGTTCRSCKGWGIEYVLEEDEDEQSE